MIKQLDTKEILRYMGYPEDCAADERIGAMIEKCSAQLLFLARPKYIEKQFAIDRADNEIRLVGSEIRLGGQSIYKHLSDCESCVVMAATLGIEADRAIRRAQLSSVSEALVMDACATTYIEAFCDEAEAEINQKYGACNFRFSPGYGDLPISLQRELLLLLQAEKRIGLCVNASNLLIPGKSVTAILGVQGKDVVQQGCMHPKNKCELCPNKERCAFTRYGK